MTIPTQLDAQALLGAYRARVRAALGTAVEPALWDAAVADATVATVTRQNDEWTTDG